MNRGKISRNYGFWGGALMVALSAALVHWRGLDWLLAYLIAINAVTLVFYGIDKALSRGRKLPRVPERTLHFIALAGGTPAAILGQQLFRHKTLKGSFRFWFWWIAAAQLALVGLWLYWQH